MLSAQNLSLSLATDANVMMLLHAPPSPVIDQNDPMQNRLLRIPMPH